jgi:hypothetical protein
MNCSKFVRVEMVAVQDGDRNYFPSWFLNIKPQKKDSGGSFISHGPFPVKPRPLPLGSWGPLKSLCSGGRRAALHPTEGLGPHCWLHRSGCGRQWSSTGAPRSDLCHPWLGSLGVTGKKGCGMALQLGVLATTSGFLAVGLFCFNIFF